MCEASECEGHQEGGPFHTCLHENATYVPIDAELRDSSAGPIAESLPVLWKDEGLQYAHKLCAALKLLTFD